MPRRASSASPKEKRGRGRQHKEKPDAADVLPAATEDGHAADALDEPPVGGEVLAAVWTAADPESTRQEEGEGALPDDPLAMVMALRREIQGSLRVAEAAERSPTPRSHGEPASPVRREARLHSYEAQHVLEPTVQPGLRLGLEPEREPEREREREPEPEPEPESELQAVRFPIAAAAVHQVPRSGIALEPESEQLSDFGLRLISQEPTEQDRCEKGGFALEDDGEDSERAVDGRDEEPVTVNGGKKDYVSIFDKLLDPRLFTGHHKYQHVDQTEHTFRPTINPVSQELVARGRRDDKQARSPNFLERFDEWSEQKQRKMRYAEYEAADRETSGRHFSPVVNPTSEVLAVKVRGAHLTHNQIIGRLIRVEAEKQEWLEIKREELGEQDVLEGCTFHPRINEKSRQIAGQPKDSHGGQATKNVYNRLAQPKLLIGRREELQAAERERGGYKRVHHHDGQRCEVVTWHSHVPGRDTWQPFQTKIEGGSAWSILPTDVVTDDLVLSKEAVQEKRMKMRQHQKEYKTLKKDAGEDAGPTKLTADSESQLADRLSAVPAHRDARMIAAQEQKYRAEQADKKSKQGPKPPPRTHRTTRLEPKRQQSTTQRTPNEPRTREAADRLSAVPAHRDTRKIAAQEAKYRAERAAKKTPPQTREVADRLSAVPAHRDTRKIAAQEAANTTTQQQKRQPTSVQSSGVQPRVDATHLPGDGLAGKDDDSVLPRSAAGAVEIDVGKSNDREEQPHSRDCDARQAEDVNHQEDEANQDGDAVVAEADLAEDAAVTEADLVEREEDNDVDENSELIFVDCPEGVFPGDIITVNTPGGETFELEVPEGVAAGDQFEVRISTDAQEESAEEWSDDDVISLLGEQSASDAMVPEVSLSEQPTEVQGKTCRDFLLLVLPNEHVASSRKVRIQAASLDELGESLGEIVGVADAVICAPSDKASDEAMYTTLDEITDKAKVMVWPATAFFVDPPEEEAEGSASASASETAGLGPVPATPSPRPAAGSPAPTEFTLMVVQSDIVPAARKVKCTAASLSVLIEHVQQKVGAEHVASACGLSLAVEPGIEPTQLTNLADVPAKGKVQLWPLERFVTAMNGGVPAPKTHKFKKGKPKPPPPKGG